MSQSYFTTAENPALIREAIPDGSHAASVYLLRNKVNSHSYIGKCSGEPGRRWMEHISAARHESPFPIHRAIRKYDPASFVATVLWIGPSERASDMEIYFIMEMKTFQSRHGYNATAGGDGIVGYRHTKEVRSRQSQRARNQFSSVDARKKASEKTKSFWENPEWREKAISAIRSGIRSQIRKPLSDEERKRRSDAARKRWSNPEYRANQEKACKILWADGTMRHKRIDGSLRRYSRPEEREKKSERMRVAWARRKALSLEVS